MKKEKVYATIRTINKSSVVPRKEKEATKYGFLFNYNDICKRFKKLNNEECLEVVIYMEDDKTNYYAYQSLFQCLKDRLKKEFVLRTYTRKTAANEFVVYLFKGE